MTEKHDHRSPIRLKRAFVIGFALNMIFVLVEGAFGLISGSLALLADAGHNLTDVLALLLAWGANALMKRPPTGQRTYGWRRASILAAVVNAFILLVIVGGIGWEAVLRLKSPSPIAGSTIIWVASVGVVINTLTALLFISGRKTDLNIRGVFLHMTADAGVSAGVVLAGLAILVTGWVWLDPAVSLAVVGVILVSTWGLFKESFNLAVDAVPADINAASVREYLCSLAGVMGVHDLHIWGLSTSETALTAHLVKPDSTDDDALIKEASEVLHDRFGIGHVTLQWEREADSYQCDIPERDMDHARKENENPESNRP
jgi:cobalt-zinc-cadmium efflux system protein